MKVYILNRLLGFIPVILGVATIAFSLIHLLPGDPAQVMLAKSGASAAEIVALRAELGLDEPLHVQYFTYLSNAIRGDFGNSIFQNRPVTTIISEVLPNTLELAFAALLISVLLGTLLGVISAVYQNSWLDNASVLLSVVGVSMPVFWFSLLMILVFASNLRWLPSTGQGSLRHLILPALVLGFSFMGTTTRTVRSSMLEVLNEKYVTTARAKGLGERSVILRHALRNALIPVITLIGLQFGFLLGGTVIVETIFGRQGIGFLLVNAIINKDFPLVQAGILLSAVMYLVINLAVDILYGFIDPRIRYD